MTRALALPDGALLAYDDVGAEAGPPVLFVHGFPLDRTMWAPQVEALAPAFRCIVPDLRGLGDSNLGDEPASIERYADDLEALLDALGVGRAVVVGLSMGGYVALAFKHRHPERVRALALLDTRAGIDTEEGRAKRHELIALARAEGSAAVAERQVKGLLGKTTRAERPELAEALRAIMSRQPVDGVVSAIEAMLHRPDATVHLSSTTVPTLVVVGDEDTVTPPREARAMADAIPEAQLEIVAGAGHLSNVEQPEIVNQVLRAWLDSVHDARP